MVQSYVLTLFFLAKSSTSERDIDIYEFFRWITFQLQSPHQHIIDLNIQILDALFHIPEYREAFWKTTHAIDSLVNILKKTQEKNAGPQKIYEIMFALWLLTFNKTIAENLDRYVCLCLEEANFIDVCLVYKKGSVVSFQHLSA